MLKVGGSLTIYGDRCPPIFQYFYLVGPQVKHRFDRQDHPLRQPDPGIRLPKIGQLGVFMELLTDSMTDKIADHTVTI